MRSFAVAAALAAVLSGAPGLPLVQTAAGAQGVRPQGRAGLVRIGGRLVRVEVSLTRNLQPPVTPESAALAARASFSTQDPRGLPQFELGSIRVSYRRNVWASPLYIARTLVFDPGHLLAFSNDGPALPAGAVATVQVEIRSEGRTQRVQLGGVRVEVVE